MTGVLGGVAGIANSGWQSGWRSAAHSAWRWWVSEISGFVPGRAANGVAMPAADVIISVDTLGTARRVDIVCNRVRNRRRGASPVALEGEELGS